MNILFSFLDKMIIKGSSIKGFSCHPEECSDEGSGDGEDVIITAEDGITIIDNHA